MAIDPSRLASSPTDRAVPRYQVVGASAGAGERLEQDRHSRVGPLRPELSTEFPIRAPSCQVHPRLGIGSCREKPFGLYGSAEIVKWRIRKSRINTIPRCVFGIGSLPSR